MTEETINGFRVLTLTPHRTAPGVELVYNHGGAYVFPLQAAHWWLIKAIIKRTGARVTVPLYGLAPQHTVDDALLLLDTVMSRIRRRAGHNPVFMAGDSAGGGLSIAHTIERRNADATVPDALFLFSPWVDCTMTNPDIAPLQRRDAMLAPKGLRWCGQAWAGRRELDDPRVSPIFDTLEGLPPMYIHQGDHDIFLADVVRFAARAAQSGMTAQLHLCKGGFHVFAGATFTPEAQRSIKQVASIINQATHN